MKTIITFILALFSIAVMADYPVIYTDSLRADTTYLSEVGENFASTYVVEVSNLTSSGTLSFWVQVDGFDSVKVEFTERFVSSDTTVYWYNYFLPATSQGFNNDGVRGDIRHGYVLEKRR